MGLTVLLIAHNVSGVFDELSTTLSVWLAELRELFFSQQPDFVALHLQEVGGSHWEKPGLTKAVDALTQALDAEFADFWSSSMFVNLDPTRDFTALGSIYLVRTSVLSQVAIFDSAANSYKQLDTLPAPLLPAPALPDTYCEHERFPQDYYREAQNWSRKGRLHTRWRLGETELELVNVHNFHDACNLRALERKGDERLSVFARSRSHALAHTVDCMLERLSPSLPPPACFLFGDFNFRLDLPSVIEQLYGSEGLELARSLSPAKSSKKGKATVAADEASGTNGEAGDKPPSRTEAELQCPKSAGGGQLSSNLTLSSKTFRFSQPQVILDQLELFRACDRELDEFSNASSVKLHELELAFAPSYPYVHFDGAEPLDEENPLVIAKPDDNATANEAATANGVFGGIANGTSNDSRNGSNSNNKNGSSGGGGGHNKVAESSESESGTRGDTTTNADDSKATAESEDERAALKRTLSQAAQEELAVKLARQSSRGPLRGGFGRKRCPAWCDRVLMDPVAQRLVEKSEIKATYSTQAQRTVICDHNKVFLAFSCA